MSINYKRTPESPIILHYDMKEGISDADNFEILKDDIIDKNGNYWGLSIIRPNVPFDIVYNKEVWINHKLYSLPIKFSKLDEDLYTLLQHHVSNKKPSTIRSFINKTFPRIESVKDFEESIRMGKLEKFAYISSERWNSKNLGLEFKGCLDIRSIVGILKDACDARVPPFENRQIIPGINEPSYYIGNPGSAFQLHCEDMNLWSLNTSIEGEKEWFTVPLSYNSVVFESFASEYDERCPGYKSHKAFFPMQSFFIKRNIPLGHVIQKRGDTVLTYPGGLHFGFNPVMNFNVAINYGDSKLWIPKALTVKRCDNSFHVRYENQNVFWPMDWFLNKYMESDNHENSQVGTHEMLLEKDREINTMRQMLENTQNVLIDTEARTSTLEMKIKELEDKLSKPHPEHDIASLPNRKFNCYHCGTKYNNHYSRSTCEQRHRGLIFECPVCKKQLSASSNLNKHVKRCNSNATI